MAKFRGITWNNSRFGPKIQIRRSIDLAELGDLGNITDNANDLPTRGALHRADKGGSTSGTRQYTDFRGIAGQYSNVVDTQDMGLISETATAHRVWSSTGAISDTTSSSSSSSSSTDPTDYNWTVTTSFDTDDSAAYTKTADNLGGTYGQIEEGGTTGTWEISTNAPDGVQVFTTTVTAYVGTYQYSNDPSVPGSEWDGSNYPSYGWKTVSNGKISGTWGAKDDGYTENGEITRLSVRSSTNPNDELATSEWFEIIDAE